jgi:SAM-dependent methyltransferase
VNEMSNGWNESASAWIAALGERGDYTREFVLDPPMIEHLRERHFTRALDVGCGEGRFCRIMQQLGIQTVGIDPTEALLNLARERDPKGDYRIGRAEKLDFPDASFDLVVSYLTLIDIPDIAAAISEMARVLAPGGQLLIANLTNFYTASIPGGWTQEPNGERRLCIDHYLDERYEWLEWKGIRIHNWHRPLSRYMQLLLEQNLILRHFSEPEPAGGDPAMMERYRRVPFFMMMKWEKSP